MVVQVTLDMFCEAAVQHCEGNISFLDMLDDKIAVQKPQQDATTQQANLGAVSPDCNAGFDIFLVLK